MQETSVEDLPMAIRKALAANHAKFLDLFQTLDCNKDGSVNQDEFAMGLQTLGLTVKPAELEHLFDALDVDDDGTVQLIELSKMLRSKQKLKAADDYSGRQAMLRRLQVRLSSKPKSNLKAPMTDALRYIRPARLPSAAGRPGPSLSRPAN